MASIQPWIGSELAPKAGFINFSNDCLEEVAVILRLLKANPMPLLALFPDDMELPHFLNLSKKIRNELNQGLGFIVLNKLPIANIASVQYLISMGAKQGNVMQKSLAV